MTGSALCRDGGRRGSVGIWDRHIGESVNCIHTYIRTYIRTFAVYKEACSAHFCYTPISRNLFAASCSRVGTENRTRRRLIRVRRPPSSDQPPAMRNLRVSVHRLYRLVPFPTGRFVLLEDAVAAAERIDEMTATTTDVDACRMDERLLECNEGAGSWSNDWSVTRCTDHTLCLVPFSHSSSSQDVSLPSTVNEFSG
jgi:hypothetical protein